VHKTTGKARLVAQDQNGTKLMELASGYLKQLGTLAKLIRA
jgi:hypothetical protein